MTSLSRKRKWAGEPVKDKRKIVPEPPKNGHAPKPREYVLVTRKHYSYYTEETKRFPSRAARDQARADVEKKVRGEVFNRWRWYKDYKVTPEFEEREE